VSGGDAVEVLLFRPRTHLGSGNREGCLGKDGRIPVEVDDSEVERDALRWPSCLGGRREEIPSESMVTVDIGRVVRKGRASSRSSQSEIWRRSQPSIDQKRILSTWKQNRKQCHRLNLPSF
jgi:hypothetical protein